MEQTEIEDSKLNKLVWFRNGNEVSERQWLDILGVMKVQGKKLDEKYLEKWSQHLEVYHLLKKAYGESGLEF